MSSPGSKRSEDPKTQLPARTIAAKGRPCLSLENSTRYPQINNCTKGIQYVTDEQGDRIAVQIDLRKHARESRTSLKEVKRRLKRKR
jgi:hypothetical protein